jgi:hypothetical protein
MNLSLHQAQELEIEQRKLTYATDKFMYVVQLRITNAEGRPLIIELYNDTPIDISAVDGTAIYALPPEEV